MPPHDHLLQETNILPVHRHVRLLCVQQQLSRYLTYHPSHSFLHKHPHPRQIMETLHTRYNRYVTPYLNETENKTHVTPKEHKRILKDLHTLEVKDAIENYAPSKDLETMSPKISEDEKSLPRGSRRKLAQLRSGFSCLLQSYNHRIKLSYDDKCPDCRKSEHTTRHLFSCPKRRTRLTPETLWRKPVEAVKFLGLQTCEAQDD